MQQLTFKIADKWRSQPGYLAESGSDFESVRILLGRFLCDRIWLASQSPTSDKSL